MLKPCVCTWKPAYFHIYPKSAKGKDKLYVEINIKQNNKMIAVWKLKIKQM